MLRRAAALWLLAGSAIFVAACGDDGADDTDDHSDESVPIGPPSGSECPPGSTLTYETFGREFMEGYCVRCHSSELEGLSRQGAPEGLDFDVYEVIIAVADHIDQYAAAGPDSVNETMPPTVPRPTQEERVQLGQWLACELAAADPGAP